MGPGPNLIAPAQQVQHHAAAGRDQRRQVLFGLNNDPCHAHLAGLEQGLAQQGINLGAFVYGRDIVGPFQVNKRNVARFDERFNFNSLGSLGIGVGNVFVAQHDVLAFLVGNALDDVFLANVLTRFFVDAPVAHRVHAALVQPVKVQTRFCRCRMQAHRNMYQSETDGTFP